MNTMPMPPWSSVSLIKYVPRRILPINESAIGDWTRVSSAPMREVRVHFRHELVEILALSANRFATTSMQVLGNVAGERLRENTASPGEVRRFARICAGCGALADIAACLPPWEFSRPGMCQQCAWVYFEAGKRQHPRRPASCRRL